MLDPASPLLSVSVLETALRGATDPAVRVQILAALVQVFERDAPSRTPSTGQDLGTEQPPHASQQPTRPAPPTAHHDPTRVLAARLDLADAYFGITVPDVHAAAAEAGIVERESKRILKRDPANLSMVALRKRAALILARSDDALGRDSRAERWRSVAAECDAL